MKRLLLIAVLIFSVVTNLSAKTESILKVHTLNQLMENVLDVEKVMQDDRGFIWIASASGLYRYDGYSFVEFRMDGVHHFYIDNCNNIWCTCNERVVLFDTKKCCYVDVLAEYSKKTEKKYEINKIRTMPDGYTWLLCEDNTCLRINNNNPQKDIKQVSVGNKCIETIFVDKDGRTWLLSDDLTYIYDNGKLLNYSVVISTQALMNNRIWIIDDKGNLCYYSYKKKKIEEFTPLKGQTFVKFKKISDSRALAMTSNKSFYLDDNGNILGAYSNIDTDSYFEDSNGRLLCFDNVRIYFEDKFGTLWIFTKSGELKYLNRTTNSLVPYNISGFDLKDLRQTFADMYGNLWLVTNYKIYIASFHQHNFSLLPDYEAHTRMLFKEKNGRYWIAEKHEPVVRIYNPDNTLAGFLGSDGKISKTPADFKARVYAIYEDKTGTIWIGTKPKGLFRLVPDNKTSYSITNYTMESTNSELNCNEVVEITEDKFGRLWLGTFGGGLNCILNPHSSDIKFVNADNCFSVSDDVDARISNIRISSKEILYATTPTSLLIADINKKNLKELTINQHTKEEKRASSLSSNAIMGLTESASGSLYICTQTGGLNELPVGNHLAKSLNFNHYNTSNGLPSDVCQNVVEYRNTLWITGTNQLLKLNEKSHNIDAFLSNEGLIFSNAKPIHLSGSTWLFGLRAGCAYIDLDRFSDKIAVPDLRITAVTIQNNPADYSYASKDTIILSADQRDLKIDFAALDFSGNSTISYAYQLEGRSDEWQYVGKTNNVLFVNLSPKTYTLKLRSTNAEGAWVDNDRTITIIVTPTFWETGWAILLYVVIILLLIYIAYRTHSYIERIKKQQKDTLEAYLNLIDNHEEESRKHELKRKQLLKDAKVEAQNDAIIKRIMEFIDSHISDSDVSIDDMAAAAAVSKSLLHVKIKQIFGITPGKLIAEARIQKACNLLEDDNLSIIEIAFACGFSDPKYFSRCFKNSVGDTPTEYRLKL